MKKLIKSTFLPIFLLSALLFTGCFNYVYYNINNDVPPLSATMNGTIRAVTRYNAGGTEFLVTITEDGLCYKPATGNDEHGQWKLYEKLPEAYVPHHYDYYGTSDHVGQQLLVTHADSNTLYLVAAEYKDDDDEGIVGPSKIYVWAKQITLKNDTTWSDDGKWTSILEDNSGINYTPFYLYSSAYYSAFAIFSTNAVQPSHRKVFIRTGDVDSEDDDYTTTKYYEISGLNSPEEISVTPLDYSDTEENNAQSAVWFNGQVQFFNSIASTTNETATTDASVVYYSYKKYLYYKKASDSAFTKSDFSLGNYATVLCVCSDSLIVGRGNYESTSSSGTGGVVKTSLNENGIIGSDLTTFDTNIETQLQNAYFIITLLNVDPSKKETEATLYSSVDFIGTGSSTSAKYSDVGLWSYYPARGNWNRE